MRNLWSGEDAIALAQSQDFQLFIDIRAAKVYPVVLHFRRETNGCRPAEYFRQDAHRVWYGCLGCAMETEEIRANILDARRLCAEARMAGLDRMSDTDAVNRVADVMARLADAAEELLAEREAFAGRLRRTPALRAVELSPISPMAYPSRAGEGQDAITPSPGPDV